MVDKNGEKWRNISFFISKNIWRLLFIGNRVKGESDSVKGIFFPRSSSGRMDSIWI